MHTNQQATNQVSHPMQQQPVVIGKVFQPKDMVNIVNMFNQNNQMVSGPSGSSDKDAQMQAE